MTVRFEILRGGRVGQDLKSFGLSQIARPPHKVNPPYPLKESMLFMINSPPVRRTVGGFSSLPYQPQSLDSEEHPTLCTGGEAGGGGDPGTETLTLT